MQNYQHERRLHNGVTPSKCCWAVESPVHIGGKFHLAFRFWTSRVQNSSEISCSATLRESRKYGGPIFILSDVSRDKLLTGPRWRVINGIQVVFRWAGSTEGRGPHHAENQPQAGNHSFFLPFSIVGSSLPRVARTPHYCCFQADDRFKFSWIKCKLQRAR